MKKLLKSVLAIAVAATVGIGAAPKADAMTQAEKDRLLKTMSMTPLFSPYFLFLLEKNLVVDGWHWDKTMQNDYGTYIVALTVKSDLPSR